MSRSDAQGYVERKQKQKHTVNRKEKEYGYGDCFLYKIFCSCGKECGGWTSDKAEEEYKKHVQESK